MSVYVDEPIWTFGRMKMCHMAADSLDELLAMADRIGVARKWIQHPETPSRRHFDICKSKRERAIAAGAIPLSTRDLCTRDWSNPSAGPKEAAAR